MQLYSYVATVNIVCLVAMGLALLATIDRWNAQTDHL